jgi:DNA-binding GntR family transcriptional regulator
MSEHEGLAAKILARDTDGFASALRHHLDTNHRG